METQKEPSSFKKKGFLRFSVALFVLSSFLNASYLISSHHHTRDFSQTGLQAKHNTQISSDDCLVCSQGHFSSNQIQPEDHPSQPDTILVILRHFPDSILEIYLFGIRKGRSPPSLS